MRKLLLNGFIVGTTLLGVSASTMTTKQPKVEQSQVIENIVEDYIVENCDYSINMDYIISIEKSVLYDRTIVKKDDVIYKGTYYLYFIDCYYYNETKDLTKQYVADVIVDDYGKENILSFKEN